MVYAFIANRVSNKMAHIYDRPGTKKKIARELGMVGATLDDIEKCVIDLKKSLSENEHTFFEKLPGRIAEEKKRFSSHEDKKKEILSDKDTQGRERGFITRHIIRPISLYMIGRKIKSQAAVIEALEKRPKDVFSEEQRELIGRIEEIDTKKHTKDYAGAIGEKIVLKELQKLSDDFHVLCDITLEHPDYISYGGGARNLKSAQIDFVVVGKTGVFVIEVKNWTSKSVENSLEGFTPHEQVDRAGLLMYIRLKNIVRDGVDVKKLLVPLKDNIPYLPEYKHVLVVRPSNLNNFIMTQKESLSYETVNKIVKRI